MNTYTFKIKNRIDHQSTLKKLKQILSHYSVDSDKAIIIASELITNILKFAKEGMIHLESQKNYIKIIAIDHGPGIKNVKEALTDGFTTSDSLGMGLPAIQRLSDALDIETSSKGSKITATLHIRT